MHGTHGFGSKEALGMKRLWLILASLGGIPRPGEQVTIGRYELAVLDADERRILKVKVRAPVRAPARAPDTTPAPSQGGLPP